MVSLQTCQQAAESAKQGFADLQTAQQAAHKDAFCPAESKRDLSIKAEQEFRDASVAQSPSTIQTKAALRGNQARTIYCLNPQSPIALASAVGLMVEVANISPGETVPNVNGQSRIETDYYRIAQELRRAAVFLHRPDLVQQIDAKYPPTASQ
jgi:hypothetical protein